MLTGGDTNAKGITNAGIDDLKNTGGKTMKLTKQQAIEGHRKMWNWIADEIEKRNKVLEIIDLKVEYCTTNNLLLQHNCFCCEYSIDDDYGCEKCPVDWINTKHCSDDETSLYVAVLHTKQWQEQADLARQIANLPERKDIE